MLFRRILNIYNQNNTAILLVNFNYELFTNDEYKNLFNDVDYLKEDEKYNTFKFIITNIFQELINENNTGYVFDSGDLMACIVNFRENDNVKNMADLQQIVNTATDFIYQHFNIYISVSASTIRTSLSSIQSAYVEALDTMEYKVVMAIDTFMDYSDIKEKNSSTVYFYDTEKEQQLINYVRVGDFENSKLLLGEILDLNFNLNEISSQAVKCLMFDLIGTMFKTISVITTKVDQDFIEGLAPTDRLFNCNSIVEIKTEMTDILKSFCEYIKLNYTNNDIIDKTKEYIDKNYLDSELNVNAIGDAFNLTASYISKNFKLQEQITILDYINKMRIEKSKKLLAETDTLIETIATECGYNNIFTFLRIFKKYVGTTPGKFREHQS